LGNEVYGFGPALSARKDGTSHAAAPWLRGAWRRQGEYRSVTESHIRRGGRHSAKIVLYLD